MEKYRELYNLAKEVFDEELTRFHRLEEKAARYLTSLSFLIAGYGFFGNWILNNFLPPQGFLDWAMLIVGGLVFLGLAGTWFLIIGVFVVSDLVKIPLSDEVIEFFDENELIDIYYAMANGISRTCEQNRNTNDRKILRLSRAYFSLIVTVTMFIGVVVIFALDKWINIQS